MRRFILSIKRRFATTWMRKRSGISQAEIPSNLSPDTPFYILGSGESVNELGEQQWSQIESAQSVGFNFWLLHDHVPTYYMLEGFRDRAEEDFFFARLEERKEDYRDVVWLLGAPEILLYSGDLMKFIKRFPFPIEGKVVWMDYEISLVRHGKSFSAGSFGDPPHSIFGKHVKGVSSSTLALSVGYSLGATELVLAGVDLTGSTYFWQHDGHPHREFRAHLINKEHKSSTNPTYRPVQDHILAYERHVLEPNSRQLTIATDRGLLSNHLKTHEWDSKVEGTQSTE